MSEKLSVEECANLIGHCFAPPYGTPPNARFVGIRIGSDNHFQQEGAASGAKRACQHCNLVEIRVIRDGWEVYSA